MPIKTAKNTKLHLATITILVKDRQMHAPEVNRILTENGHLILARLGVNVQRHCIEHCTAIITVALEASAKDINRITKELDQLYGITAKSLVLV
jgi:putative iron-only hydrogenase system regulator